MDLVSFTQQLFVSPPWDYPRYTMPELLDSMPEMTTNQNKLKLAFKQLYILAHLMHADGTLNGPTMDEFQKAVEKCKLFLSEAQDNETGPICEG